MPFGVKNGPPILSKGNHQINKCFLKCREYGISLNPKKCAFMVCSGTILRFIVSKEKKRSDLKKIEIIVKMPMPKTP